MQVAHVPRRRGNHFECEPSDTESQFGGGGLLRDADGMGRPRRPRRRPVKWRARTAQPSGKSKRKSNYANDNRYVNVDDFGTLQQESVLDMTDLSSTFGESTSVSALSSVTLSSPTPTHGPAAAPSAVAAAASTPPDAAGLVAVALAYSVAAGKLAVRMAEVLLDFNPTKT